MAEPRDWVGQIVGEYRLLSKLGGGSFGQVYLAEHIRDSNQVALKLLQVHLTAGGGSYTYIRVQVLATATALAPTAMKTYAAHVAKNGIMFGFDAQHTHYNPYERIVNTTNVSYLQQLWTAPTGAEIDSSPAIVNGLVYVGSDDDNLYAFSLFGTKP